MIRIVTFAVSNGKSGALVLRALDIITFAETCRMSMHENAYLIPLFLLMTKMRRCQQKTLHSYSFTRYSLNSFYNFNTEAEVSLFLFFFFLFFFFFFCKLVCHGKISVAYRDGAVFIDIYVTFYLEKYFVPNPTCKIKKKKKKKKKKKDTINQATWKLFCRYDENLMTTEILPFSEII